MSKAFDFHICSNLAARFAFSFSQYAIVLIVKMDVCFEDSFATIAHTRNSYISTGFVMVHSVTISYLHVAATRFSRAMNFQSVYFSLKGQIPDNYGGNYYAYNVDNLMVVFLFVVAPIDSDC